jgi:hypothetical protein
MADMVARESMRWLMNVVEESDAPRSSCLAGLIEKHRLHWHHFHKDYFVQRVSDIKKLIDEGHPVGNYEQWRRRKNCQDTTENRIRYHVQIDRMLRDKLNS